MARFYVSWSDGSYMKDPYAKVGVVLALNESSCEPLMVFILRFSFKSLKSTLNGQYLVSFSDSMDAYC